MVCASVFIALSAFFAKGVAGRFVDISDGQPLHPLQITAGRFLFASILWVIVFAWMRPGFQPIHWTLHTARSIFGWLTITCVFWAGSLMALADATAISFLTPVVTLILAVTFLGEKVGWIRWSAVSIMLVGALVLLRPGTSAFQPAALIALAAALFSGVEAMLIKRISGLEPRLQILLINNGIGLIIAMAAAAFVWISPNAGQWLVLALVGLSMAVAQVFFLTSMRDGEASYVISFMYSTLIFVSVLDYYVFGDAPDALGFLGAGIIVMGAIFLALRESARKNRD